MSMSLHVQVDGAGCLEHGDLWQTPSAVTYAILREGTWQAQARAYLAWVAGQCAADFASKWPAVRARARASVKAQRREIGRLWRIAEEGGGRLVFSAG